MKNIKIIILLFVSLNLFGQENKKDAVLWTTLSLQKKLDDKSSLKLVSRARFGDNFSHLNSYYVDIGYFYEIVNNLKVSVNYVYSPTRQTDFTYRRLHQYYASLTYKYDLNSHWAIKSRTIFQHTSHYLFVENGYKPYSRTNFREKLSLNRKISRRNSIYLEDEISIPVFSDQTGIRRNRLYAGFDHAINKQFTLDLFFVLQHVIHHTYPSTDFVYGFTLNYQF